MIIEQASVELQKSIECCNKINDNNYNLVTGQFRFVQSVVGFLAKLCIKRKFLGFIKTYMRFKNCRKIKILNIKKQSLH